MSTETSVAGRSGARPAPTGPKPLAEAAAQLFASLVMLWVLVAGPFVALLAAVPVAWGWGLSGPDAVMR